MANSEIEIRLAIEGTLDQTVVERLITEVGGVPLEIHRYKKSEMRKKIDAFNSSASHLPWVVLVDLDHDNTCAPELCHDWLPNPAEHMCFRVVIREIEAWILADRERLARFISVPVFEITEDPESIDYPKEYLINLARKSTDRKIVDAMVPRRGSGRVEGPAYISYMIEFITDKRRGWRHDVAASHSDSLNRCIKSLERMLE